MRKKMQLQLTTVRELVTDGLIHEQGRFVSPAKVEKEELSSWEGTWEMQGQTPELSLSRHRDKPHRAVPQLAQGLTSTVPRS